MATVTGIAVRTGDTVRIGRHWYTITSTPAPVIIDGKAYDKVLAADVRDQDGGNDHLTWLADDELATPGTTGTLIRYWPAGGSQARTIEITYRRREYRDGWNVCLPGGRRLGWLVPARSDDGTRAAGWDARIVSDAFRGDDPDDQGDPLDEVPRDLYNGDQDGGSKPVAWGRNRDEAAAELVQILDRRNAPALGHGPHPRVRRHDSVFCRGSRRRWATDGDGPACPVCHRSPASLDTVTTCRRPRRHGDGWAGTVPFHTTMEHQR